jgi:polyhydroxyalkanoate synthesis regulator phasin
MGGPDALTRRLRRQQEDFPMSDDKNKVTDKASEIAKNIWLAGVGAYGKAVDEAQDRLEKAGVETPKLFRDLVKAGTALEEEAKDALHASQAARSSVEERISRVRENFHLQRPARGEDLLALHEKIDRIANQLSELTSALAEQGVLKPTRTRSGTKKKSAAKKPVTRKKTAASKAAVSKKTAAKARAKPGAGKVAPRNKARTSKS